MTKEIEQQVLLCRIQVNTGAYIVSIVKMNYLHEQDSFPSFKYLASVSIFISAKNSLPLCLSLSLSLPHTHTHTHNRVLVLCPTQLSYPFDYTSLPLPVTELSCNIFLGVFEPCFLLHFPF